MNGNRRPLFWQKTSVQVRNHLQESAAAAADVKGAVRRRLLGSLIPVDLHVFCSATRGDNVEARITVQIHNF